MLSPIIASPHCFYFCFFNAVKNSAYLGGRTDRCALQILRQCNILKSRRSKSVHICFSVDFSPYINVYFVLFFIFLCIHLFLTLNIFIYLTISKKFQNKFLFRHLVRFWEGFWIENFSTPSRKIKFYRKWFFFFQFSSNIIILAL